jgi:hypothetical protein
MVIRQFWPLGVDDAIEVHHAKAGLGNLCCRGGQHFGRVAAPIGGLGVRKQAANIGQGGGSQYGVGYRVQQDIGVAMADKLSVMRHVDSPQPQRPAGGGAVRVFADSNPQIARGANSRLYDSEIGWFAGLYRFTSEELNGNGHGFFRWFTQPHVKLRAIVKHLGQFDLGLKVVIYIRLDLGQQLEGRTEAHVYRGLPLARDELSQKRSSQCVVSATGSEPR